MYLDGVRLRTFSPWGAQRPSAPSGVKFSTRTGPSLTNEEMRRVTQWRFDNRQQSQNRRMKWDSYQRKWVPTL